MNVYGHVITVGVGRTAGGVGGGGGDKGCSKLQALVYILPSTTAVFSYAIGSRNNEQFFFVGAQTVVGLLQTTQIISDVCFRTDHVAYANSNKNKIV